jgi:dTDP-4-dehydrorhamnose 3,5-epimerase
MTDSSAAPRQDYITETELAGVLIIERPTYPDGRGFFRETFRNGDLEARFGSPIHFLQANHSRSVKNTLRGIHIAPWHKLITVTRGEVQAVIADTRPDSPTFGKCVSLTVGDSNHISVFIPAGYGNSFAVLSDEADYVYLASDYWAPGKEHSIIYNDPDLAIKWQVSEPIISENDKTHPTLRQAYPERFSN